jgi:predicted RNA binding protein YcfA (HicA-like mRNA interferase family)
MKVRAVIKLIEADGWRLVRQTGSHRQFHHPAKPDTVTFTGKPNTEVPGRDPGSRSQPGFVEGTRPVSLIREAIPLHIESLRAHGDPVPPPSTVATMVVPAPAALASNASDA